MHYDSLAQLACSTCRCVYEKEIKKSCNNTIITGILTCPDCGIAVPVIAGFPLFNDARPLAADNSENWLEQLQDKLVVTEYHLFLHEKVIRGYTDLYAAFQPFNESTRALYPLLPMLREKLQPGDIILDTWCRTGWSGELLASLFPDNRVISIWEGNNNVLGYKGYAYWLSQKNRLHNLDIIFSHPDYPLPLLNNSVRMVHGLDSLHRYRHASFIPECLRVCDDDGVLVFPHIHLSNSQPEPFFERGCYQYHGRDWKAWLDKILANTPRSGWVLSEVDLFDMKQDYCLTDQSNMDHYNGLLLIADSQFEGRALEPCSFPKLSINSRFLKNALLEINLYQCEVKLDSTNLAGLTSSLMDRHPCYASHLSLVLGQKLSSEEARFIWHTQQGLNLQAIANAMQFSMVSTFTIAQSLCQREILHPALVSQSQMALQDFYAFLKLPEDKPDHFIALWAAIPAYYKKRPMLHWLEDESELFVDDAVYLVNAIRCQLVAAGLHAGSRILIACQHHPEALLLCWAAWLQNMVTVIVDDSLPLDQIKTIQHTSKAELFFTDQLSLIDSVISQSILLDGMGVFGEGTFSSWLEDGLDNDLWNNEPTLQEIKFDADALILFTSGSTGNPKGVVLSQRALCRSGYNMAHTHDWHEETLLSLGPFSMMSGLRNPAIAALISGSTILLPGKSTVQSPLSAWLQGCKHRVSVITAVPAWLKILMSVEERLTQLPCLKQILVAGAYLDPELCAQTQDRLGVQVGNYYGLTETGGLCAATLNDAVSGTLGMPANALVHIIDQDGLPVKQHEQGLLRVYSDQLMSRYLNTTDDDSNESSTALQQGWLLTGDLAHWDEKGRLVLNGRQDEQLKLRNGARFHPSELESVLMAFPEIEMAAVSLAGEALSLVALVVTTDDNAYVTEQIDRKLNSKLIGRVPTYWLPVRIIIVPELPVGNHGKLKRDEIAKMIKQFDHA